MSATSTGMLPGTYLVHLGLAQLGKSVYYSCHRVVAPEIADLVLLHRIPGFQMRVNMDIQIYHMIVNDTQSVARTKQAYRQTLSISLT